MWVFILSGVQFHRQTICQLKKRWKSEYRPTWLIGISLHCVSVLCMQNPIFNHARKSWNVLRYAKTAVQLVIFVAWFISIDIFRGETWERKKCNFYAKKNGSAIVWSFIILPPLHTHLELLVDSACCNVLFKVTLPFAVYRSWFSLTQSCRQ